MNELHQDALVLENVALDLLVQVVVQVPVDLLRFTVTLEKATKNSHALDPQVLAGHASVCRTLAFAIAAVTSFPPRFRVLPNASTGVDGDRLADDEAVFDELSDVLACVNGNNVLTSWQATRPISTN